MGGTTCTVGAAGASLAEEQLCCGWHRGTAPPALRFPAARLVNLS